MREVTVGPAYRPKKGEAVIDEKGRVIVDGRPFMAVGLYTNFADHRKYKPDELEAHFRKMHDAGFNFMIDYGTYLLNTKERRDRYYGLCKKYGIRVLADDFAGLQQHIPSLGHQLYAQPFNQGHAACAQVDIFNAAVRLAGDDFLC